MGLELPEGHECHVLRRGNDALHEGHVAVEVVMVDRIDEVPAQHRVDVLEIDDHASLRIEGSTDRHLDDVVVAVVGSTGAEDLTVAFVGPVRAA